MVKKKKFNNFPLSFYRVMGIKSQKKNYSF
jgi:hypothetical protein